MRYARTSPLYAPLTLLALGLLQGATTAQQELVDDFRSGHDQSWTHIDLLAANKLGKTIYDASSQRYRIASSDKLPPLPVLAATVSAFTKSLTDARFSNGVLRVTVRFDNGDTNAGVLLRTDPAQLNGYMFTLNNHENMMYISRVYRGGGTKGGIGGVTHAPIEVKENTDYVLEATALGGELTLKAWESSQTPPPAPQLRVVDNAYATGALGVLVYNQPSEGGGKGGTLSGQFDDVMFTPCATVTEYGSGCPGKTGVPDFRVVGRATGGEAIYLSVREARANALSIILLGTARAKGTGGCQAPLLVDQFLIGFPLGLSVIGDGAVRLTIPNVPNLRGTATFQAVVVDNTSVLGVATSPGLELLFR